MDRLVDIYFFSGTGNTYLVVKTIKSELERHNYKVKLLRLEKIKPDSIPTDKRLIGFAMPVASFSTFRFVWKFFEQLPEVEDVPVFFVDTLAHASYGLIGPIKKLLENKGYKPILATEIIMPNNFLILQSKAVATSIKKKGLAKARAFARDLISGKTDFKSQGIWATLLSFISRAGLSFFTIRNFIIIRPNYAKCKSCGLCEQLCPVNNIKMLNGMPKFYDRCEICLRCITFCPHKAIFINRKKRKLYKAMDAEELLSI